jgi:hypothetical protein
MKLIRLFLLLRKCKICRVEYTNAILHYTYNFFKIQNTSKRCLLNTISALAYMMKRTKTASRYMWSKTSTKGRKNISVQPHRLNISHTTNSDLYLLNSPWTQILHSPHTQILPVTLTTNSASFSLSRYMFNTLNSSSTKEKFKINYIVLVAAQWIIL